MASIAVWPLRFGLSLLFLAWRPVDPGNLVAEHLLDRLEGFVVSRRHQHGGEAFASRPPGPPDAMDIVLGVDRHVVIEDVAHVGDIEAARRHVARGKESDLAVAEGIESRRALVLVHVPVQRADIEAVALQRAVKSADILLAIAEDDG